MTEGVFNSTPINFSTTINFEIESPSLKMTDAGIGQLQKSVIQKRKQTQRICKQILLQDAVLNVPFEGSIP